MRKLAGRDLMFVVEFAICYIIMNYQNSYIVLQSCVQAGFKCECRDLNLAVFRG